MNDVAVCVPCSRMDEPIPNSAHEPCANCGVECWVSPSTESIRAKHPTLRLLCSDCGAQHMVDAVLRGEHGVFRLEGDQVAELLRNGMTLDDIRRFTAFIERMETEGDE